MVWYGLGLGLGLGLRFGVKGEGPAFWPGLFLLSMYMVAGLGSGCARCWVILFSLGNPVTYDVVIYKPNGGSRDATRFFRQ